MRVLLSGVLIVIVGCGVLPAVITKPTNMATVPGGLGDVRPFFGNYKLAGLSDEGKGIFLLASCGCGDWRVLFKPSDGSAQESYPVQFYARGEYKTTGLVTVYGEEGDARTYGTVDQDSGLFSGRAESAGVQKSIAAMRSSQHDQPVEACGLCHIGEDTIFPLPAWHPQKYKENPFVCLECHTLGDSGGVEDQP